ncbi:YoaK family protein [Sphaerisporangium sp. B11E5]|uniref:YoaK family protein n=1 Tax=Sphaerisporangium sp. B11E5 TaxID=3153563 RepID=UPI00325F317D
MGSGRGPLVGPVVALTVVSGMVDAVSFLRLGQVFTANMTGNVVVLGFAAGGTPGFSATGSLVSLLAFLTGAVAGGRAGRVFGERHLLVALGAETAAVGVAAGVAAWAEAGAGMEGGARYAVVAVLAAAMGLQGATVRLLALPDVTGSVLTRILTGLASESSLGGGVNPLAARRAAAVLCMFLGALTGALLVRHAGVPLTLTAVAVFLVAVALAHTAGHGHHRRQEPGGGRAGDGGHKG